MVRHEAKRPTWAEINLHNLASNFHAVRQFIGSDVKYMAVVKADAYGHGAVQCAKQLETEGVDWFGVAIPEEGIELRRSGIRKPILCLGGFWYGQENLLFEHNLTSVIYSTELAQSLNEAALRKQKVAKIHVKIDTGMGRIGVREEKIPEFISQLKALKNLEVEGIMTHFAAADDLKENDFTDLQITRFNAAVKSFKEHGFIPKYQDMANSPGAIVHPQSRGNMVRLGGILYGLGGDVLPAEIEKPNLLPVLSLHSQIAQLKVISRGETVGYGKTFTADRESLIATIPIGYQDGLPRLLSNLGMVIVNGAFVPIVGRISMDWTMIDVTGVPDVKVGDHVLLIGSQGAYSVKAEDIAKAVGTISYEITCGINQRVERAFMVDSHSLGFCDLGKPVD